ncbi:hypothetical protein GTA28_29955 [Rhodococcus hoagii]|nr:hypothetical protein [Prescottella equi]
MTAWVADQISAGEKVMIAARHREVVASYADGLEASPSAAARAQQKRTPTSGPSRPPGRTGPAITVSIEAGGVGHTLTAAPRRRTSRTLLDARRTQPMAKRIHRIGQTRPVEYLVPLAVDTIDEDMWHKIDTKQAVLAAVLVGTPDDAESADAEADAAAAIACTLARRAITTVYPQQETDSTTESDRSLDDARRPLLAERQPAPYRTLQGDLQMTPRPVRVPNQYISVDRIASTRDSVVQLIGRRQQRRDPKGSAARCSERRSSTTESTTGRLPTSPEYLASTSCKSSPNLIPGTLHGVRVDQRP